MAAREAARGQACLRRRLHGAEEAQQQQAVLVRKLQEKVRGGREEARPTPRPGAEASGAARPLPGPALPLPLPGVPRAGSGRGRKGKAVRAARGLSALRGNGGVPGGPRSLLPVGSIGSGDVTETAVPCERRRHCGFFA